jgi:integrase
MPPKTFAEARQNFLKHLAVHHYADSTQENYAACVNAYERYLRSHPETARLSPAKKIESYLTHRVVADDIKASTQNVELNALILFHAANGVQVEGINALRARRRDYIPPILTTEHVRTLIQNFPAEHRLVPQLLYGCAMRINEVLQLRVKDVNLELQKLTIHDAKGGKDRDVSIPERLLAPIRDQVERATAAWQDDVKHNFNGVNCLGYEKKYRTYPMSLDWYWLFPAESLSTDPKTGKAYMRHHVMDYSIGRLFVRVRKEHNLPVYTRPHILRHACLTHMAAHMMKQGIPEKMIKAALKDLAGHVMDQTLEGYLHLAAPKSAVVRSPIEDL